MDTYLKKLAGLTRSKDMSYHHILRLLTQGCGLISLTDV